MECRAPITSLSISFDSRLVVSGSEDGSAIVWDAMSRQSLRTYNVKSGSVTNVQIILRPPSLLEVASERFPIPNLPVWKRHQTPWSAVQPGDNMDQLSTFLYGFDDEVSFYKLNSRILLLTG
jgi:WD40 repeat protein